MRKNLTEAQIEYASTRMRESAAGLAQRIRSTWSHVLYPVAAQGGGSGTGPVAGFELEHSSVANRAPGKPIPQTVYDQLKSNTVIWDELGPDPLMAELHKVWRRTSRISGSPRSSTGSPPMFTCRACATMQR